MRKVFNIIAVLFIFSMVREILAVELDIIAVGQANFTILKNGENCLIFDCGSSIAGWQESKKFCTPHKEVIAKILSGIKALTIVISHEHDDHKNLLPPLRQLAKEKDITNITEYKGWEENDLKEKLKNALGTGIEIIPMRADFTAAATVHDKCLVLKIKTIGPNSRAILLTGDASGKACKYVKNQHSTTLTDIDVMMLSHHGSAQEEALEWVTMSAAGYKTRPLLSIISSDPNTQDHLPRYTTVETLLNNSNIAASTKQCANKGQYFCAYHHLSGYHEETRTVIQRPAIYDEDILPIFITSNAAKNNGDGIYRITVKSDGTISMKNSALNNTEQYIYVQTNSNTFDDTIYKRYMHSLFRAIRDQLMLCNEISGEISNICTTTSAKTLHDARDGFTQTPDSGTYLTSCAAVHTELQQQIICEKILAIRYQAADSIIKNVSPVCKQAVSNKSGTSTTSSSSSTPDVTWIAEVTGLFEKRLLHSTFPPQKCVQTIVLSNVAAPPFSTSTTSSSSFASISSTANDFDTKWADFLWDNGLLETDEPSYIKDLANLLLAYIEQLNSSQSLASTSSSTVSLKQSYDQASILKVLNKCCKIKKANALKKRKLEEDEEAENSLGKSLNLNESGFLDWIEIKARTVQSKT
jgi:beta-lactamase superfamily II metal-dependent hydrolase